MSTKVITLQMPTNGHWCAYSNLSLPIDVENKSGHPLEIEVHTHIQGRIAVIIREGKC